MAHQPTLVVPKWASFTKGWHMESYPFISPSRPELSAAGKNVVVTGGGTGIGKAIAIAFAQAGARSVSILGRRIDRLKSSAEAITAARKDSKTQVGYEVADLAVAEQVRSAMKSITDKVGKIDIFINNAGALPQPGPLLGYDVDLFMSGFTANALSSFNAIQAFIPLAGPEPVLINNTAGLAHSPPMFAMGAYAASKAAQLKLVEYFAAENPQLHVAQFHPGIVATEIADVPPNAPPLDAVELPGEFCVWLASPEARFLKDKVVWSNWDAEELVARAEEIKSSKLLTVLLEGVPV